MACLAPQQFLYLSNQLPALECSVSNTPEGSVYQLDSVSGRSWQETDGALNRGSEKSRAERLFTPMWAGERELTGQWGAGGLLGTHLLWARKGKGRRVLYQNQGRATALEDRPPDVSCGCRCRNTVAAQITSW